MFLTRWLSKPARPAAPRPAFRPNLESLTDRVVPHGGGFGLGNGDLLSGLLGSSTAGADTSDTAAVATHFAVRVRSSGYAGEESQASVVALDANNRPVRDYTGTVTLTSSDSAAVLPQSYTFTDSDHGRHTFKLTLNTVGDQTVTATDGSAPPLTGSATVAVDAAPVATHLFLRAERDATSGAPVRFVVAALDASNRVVRGYTGTVAITSSDAKATLPANYTFTAADHGVHVFEVTPSAAGDVTLTATDTADATITGSVTASVGEARVATHFAVVSRPRSIAGSSMMFAVVALDDSNRVVKGYTGTVSFTSSDSAATLPDSYTFTAADRGVKVFNATLSTEGSATITATDGAGLTGTAKVTVRSAADPFGLGLGLGLGGGHGRR